MKLTMFYDSHCPLCVAEVKQLRSHDKHKTLIFEDIHEDSFTTRFPSLDPQACYQRLHVLASDGTWLYGLDGTKAVWQAVGKHRWLALLRWPIIRWFSDFVYGIFARNRGIISRMIMGKEACQQCRK